MEMRVGSLMRSEFILVIWVALIWHNGLMVVEMSLGEEERENVEPPQTGLPSLKGRFNYTSYEAGFKSVWSPNHITPSPDQGYVAQTLDSSSGAGIQSKGAFLYGFVSATIQLPDNFYSAGVVTTFYVSNAELYPKEHDEIDFEFLGRVHGGRYILQTNMYMRGNTSIGREQRIHLWFDPSNEAHSYSILWTPQHIVYFVDNVPIRELVYDRKLHEMYPSRPLHVYGTIWDGSSWATNGGKDKVNYTYSPFVATYKEFILSGCAAKDDASYKRCSLNNQKISQFTGGLPAKLTGAQIESMHWVQRHYMVYDYCEDYARYPTPLFECQNKHSKRHTDEF